MNILGDHDRFARKNAMLAHGYTVKKRDDKLEEKGTSHLKEGKEASCFNCKFKTKCQTFNTMRTGGSSGAVSVGGDEKYLCEKYEEQKTKTFSMNDKQIKSLLKNAMKGNI
jgi:hypothetical protein